MKYKIYRRAEDWQAESEANDWDGWVEGPEYKTRKEANQQIKKYKETFPDSEYKVVKQ